MMMMYKNYPLVRKENELYYGYMSDPYVIYLKVEKAQKQQDIMVSRTIRLYQMSTDLEHPNITQQAERDNLYDALDVALAWLNRANRS